LAVTWFSSRGARATIAPPSCFDDSKRRAGRTWPSNNRRAQRLRCHQPFEELLEFELDELFELELEELLELELDELFELELEELLELELDELFELELEELLPANCSNLFSVA
jgi:hypothetical protein